MELETKKKNLMELKGDCFKRINETDEILSQTDQKKREDINY